MTTTSSDVGSRTFIPNHSTSAAKSAVRRASSERSARSARNWIAAAPPSHTATAEMCRNRKTWNQLRSIAVRFYNAVNGGASARSEKLLELHRRAHVALDLELAGHESRHRVQLAGHEPV